MEGLRVKPTDLSQLSNVVNNELVKKLNMII